MRIDPKWKNVAAAVFLALLLAGCAQTPGKGPTATGSAPAAQQDTTYTGSIVGKSNKAKTISISVGQEGQAQTMMVKFDDNTKGLNFAEQGEAAIITWEQRGDDKVAVEVKPKLAKLPAGVSEIKTDELFALVDSGTAMTLVDARPESRYAQAHLPGAISIPVPKLKKAGEQVLPKDKNQLLIFYCGGPT